MVGREGVKFFGKVRRVAPNPILPVGIDLVLGTVVHAGMGMAAAARLHAIAAHLLVPEESLAQGHCLQPGLLLSLQKHCVRAATAARTEEPNIIVLIGRLQLVSAGWIATRHSP